MSAVAVRRRGEAPTQPAPAHDSHAWALHQAELLRERRFADLDRFTLADEIAQVSKREYAKLESALARLLQHLLKWDHQPQRRSRCWFLSIAEHRDLAKWQMEDNQGLKSRLDDAVARGYVRGRKAAIKETGLSPSALPESNPYDWSELMEREIAWPNE